MPTKPLNFETVCKQWEYVYIPSNKLEEGSEESEEPSQKFNKQLQIIRKKVSVGNVLDDSTECFEEIVNHINAKRIQAQAFQDDINDANARVLQVDFTMAYQCKYQNEVQSTLWTRGIVNRFTCAQYHHSATKTFVICMNYQGKDKFAIGKFLDHFYENEIPEDDSVEKEIIWSDGPSLEFKNKFMRHLMDSFEKICKTIHVEVFCYLTWERSCRWSWWKSEINGKEKGDKQRKRFTSSAGL